MDDKIIKFGERREFKDTSNLIYTCDCGNATFRLWADNKRVECVNCYEFVALKVEEVYE